MNQPTEAFLIQLRDLCRNHGVDFSADSVHLGRVSFTSADESPIYRVEAKLESLEDLEYHLLCARENRLRQATAAVRGKRKT